MFTQFDKYSLWDLATDAVKTRDADTTQLEYEGEDRGQTQRFLIVLGSMLVDLFEKIESSFSSGDSQVVDFEILFYIQRKFFARYLQHAAGKEDLIREFLSEIINAWKLKGTYPFMYWIIWKVFGWEVLGSISAADAFTLSSIGSFLFDPDIVVGDHKILYDYEQMGTVGSSALTVDVFFDADFAEKYPVLENLTQEWGLGFIFSYVNTP